MHKIVNGKRVECSSDEEQQIRAEWAANDAAKASEIAKPTLEQRIAALEEKLKARP